MLILQIQVLDLDKNILWKALDSQFHDFEDAIQYFSALTNANIECIVTRNEKDFKHANLLVLTPDLAVRKFGDGGASLPDNNYGYFAKALNVSRYSRINSRPISSCS